MRVGQNTTVTRTETRTKAFVCDLCKESIDERDRGWSRDERTLKYAEGEVYPETDARIHHRLDVCGDCFHGKLKPLLQREFGVTFREHHGDDYYDKMENEP